MALLGDLMATNRRLTEEVLQRVRRLDAQLGHDDQGSGIEGVERTRASPWRSDRSLPPIERPVSGTAGVDSPAPSTPAAQ
jgi:hypothetical protein